MPVDISRTGYTGDLGYEIWIPSGRALDVWDALMEGGQAVRHQAGRHAGARRRAHRGRAPADRGGLLQQQEGADRGADVLALRDGARPPGQPDKRRFVGQHALRAEQRRGRGAQIVGLEIDWDEVEGLYDAAGLPPAVAATASRVAVPVYSDGRQVGKATSTTWSPCSRR